MGTKHRKAAMWLCRLCNKILPPAFNNRLQYNEVQVQICIEASVCERLCHWSEWSEYLAWSCWRIPPRKAPPALVTNEGRHCKRLFNHHSSCQEIIHFWVQNPWGVIVSSKGCFIQERCTACGTSASCPYFAGNIIILRWGSFPKLTQVEFQPQMYLGLWWFPLHLAQNERSQKHLKVVFHVSKRRWENRYWVTLLVRLFNSSGISEHIWGCQWWDHWERYSFPATE
jgi:hypothetical protein